MKLPQWMKQKVKNVVAGSRLTLRGEWIVSSVDANRRPQFDGDPVAALGLADVFAELRKQMPGLRIDVAPGICDVTVRLFAYDAKVSLADGRTESFYEALRSAFEEAAACVAEVPGMALRLDVVGTLCTRGAQESFRFLNKGTEVAWKASKDAAPSGLIDRLRRAAAAHGKDTQQEKESEG